MWKTLLVSIQQAISNSWNNLFHTFLSILGVVIGVAALVGILSLIDGMEAYANQQISETTGLQNLIMRTDPYQTVDGVRVRKEDYPRLDYDAYLQLTAGLPSGGQGLFQFNRNKIIQIKGDTSQTGAALKATTVPFSLEEPELSAGRSLTVNDVKDGSNIILINYQLAQNLSEEQPEQLIGQTVALGEKEYTIVGITAQEEEKERPEAWLPITSVDHGDWHSGGEPIFFRAENVDEIPALEEHLEQELKNIYGEKADQINIIRDEFRLKQVAQGFLVFRLVMGLIVGISVVVGGIGIMNVLLISVTERTREIGLRKAMGAKKKDIIFQFLAESVTISALGSLLGLLLGILGTLIVVPIIKALTEAEFGAAFTLNTLIIVSAVAIAIGVIFGTYPAIRAARLDPVEAIRRE